MPIKLLLMAKLKGRCPSSGTPLENLDRMRDWPHLLKVIAWSINSSPQGHTQFSPFFLQHFREYPSIFAFSNSTEADPLNDTQCYSNVVKHVMEDKQLSIDIFQQIHNDYCKTQED